MQRFVKAAASVTVGAAVAAIGCTVGPNYQRPHVDVPDQFTQSVLPTTQAALSATRPAAASQTAATQAVDAMDPHQAPALRWWQTFDDPQLDSLIERAARGNLDVRAATARLRQARAQYGITASGAFPTVDSAASYARNRNPGSSRTGISGSEGDTWRMGLDAGWELDIFGGVRRGVEAARRDIEAAIEDRRNVLITLTAEVALNYIEYRSFQRQLAVANANIQAQRESLGVTQKQFQAGLKTATELDVARAQALVASTEAQVPSLEQGQKQAAHALAFLLGMNPEALTEELGPVKPIPVVRAPLVPIGMPSDLLLRRPDIRRAERQLAAATARIGEAEADLFPHFNLAGSFGFSAQRFKDLGNYSSRFWTIGPSVSWPVMDFGKIRSNIRVQDSLQEQALINYQTVILGSLQEVEDAIVAFDREQVRRQSLVQSVDANERAVRLANQRYNAGLTDYLSVLDAMRSLYAAQDQLVQSERTVSTNLVALYKALGGGWEVMEPQDDKSPAAAAAAPTAAAAAAGESELKTQ
jgi:NodT family efflux transporter outer membrane factor (OMF) lipoprotein